MGCAERRAVVAVSSPASRRRRTVHVRRGPLCEGLHRGPRLPGERSLGRCSLHLLESGWHQTRQRQRGQDNQDLESSDGRMSFDVPWPLQGQHSARARMPAGRRAPGTEGPPGSTRPTPTAKQKDTRIMCVAYPSTRRARRWPHVASTKRCGYGT